MKDSTNTKALTIEQEEVKNLVLSMIFIGGIVGVIRRLIAKKE